MKISELRELERHEDIRRFLLICCNKLAIPLYLVFWLADLAYDPARKWEFLSYRVAVVSACLIIAPLIRKSKSIFRTQVLGAVFAFVNSIVITWMTFLGDGASSPYYAGLNLVVTGILAFVPVTRGFALWYLAIILAPFYALSWVRAGHTLDHALIVNSFFLFGNVSIVWIVSAYLEELRRRELRARVGLLGEVADREGIIRVKTAEGLRLTELSRQFSPQIVSAIREGKIGLDVAPHESRICAIFIDIVDSTAKATKIPNSSFNQVITMFMEDTVPILLKYDITIDKFLGDGVLAFSNDPVQHEDYVNRVGRAALEIRERIEERAEEYAIVWGEPLRIRMGIAQGPATVGFFGSQDTFRSYTALGPVMSLASRLCGAALPGQILLCDSTRRNLRGTGLHVAKAGHSRLKGFSGQFFLYDLHSEAPKRAQESVQAASERDTLLKAA